MGYYCEMHLHSSEISACGRNSAAQQLDFYKKKGYNGVFFCDHFWRGNCKIRELAWQERIDFYERAHLDAKAYGESIGIDVFFGFELGYDGADFLVLGITPDFLREHPELESMSILSLLELLRENGAFIVHAHPYREAHYISKITLYPNNVDAVETCNTHNLTERANELAEAYAAAYGLPAVCGSDYHADRTHAFAAMVFDRAPADELDVIEMIKNREYATSVFY